MTAISIGGFKDYLQRELQGKPILQRLESFIQDGTSTAGRRHEEVFTRQFLCPTIKSYFYDYARSALSLTDHDIMRGLGTEGFANCDGFGFTPARKKKHLFTKADIIKSDPPRSWFQASNEPLRGFQACPDFSISNPLPFSIVGEVKYFRGGTPEGAVRDLYDAARQAIFYLGAFNGTYDTAMVVIADCSPDYTFHEGLQLLRHELLERFTDETNIHLLTLKLS